MPRQILEIRLQQIERELVILGNMVEQALMRSVRLLQERDLEGARELISADIEINTRRFALERAVLRTFATQQPILASDLRLMAAILEITTELERIGDYAKGIAKVSLLLPRDPLPPPVGHFTPMAAHTCIMLQEALDAFIRRDAVRARTIPSRDDAVDSLYEQVYYSIIALIIEDPRLADRGNRLIWVAHNIERAADRVVNLCERILLAVSGEMIELDEELHVP